MVNTPIPHSLKSEAKKAAKILREFTVPTTKVGPDKLIPAGLLLKAKGLAIITVVKAGFLVTARGGSGVVLGKLSDDFEAEWSAPSAIGIAGLGGGFEIGAEVTDFVIILNSRASLDAFSKGGNLTLGGNFSIAAGPLGRSVEADVAVRSPAAIYTYSKTRGLFAGISVEGSALIERKDANKKFYGEDIRAYQILSGEVPPPKECAMLYDVLAMHKTRALKALERMAQKAASKATRSCMEDEGLDKYSLRPSMKQHHDTKERHSVHTTKRWSQTKTTVVTSRKSTGDVGSVYSKTEASAWSKDSTAKLVAVANYSFQGQFACDLRFERGEEIRVLTKTSSTNDWWEGICRGKTGIFPANFVTVKN